MMKTVTLMQMVCFILLILLLEYAPVKAIPVFARKYQTSCATCHAVFPKLNAFGDVFRRLGYRFPGGQDAQMVREKPVEMGAKAYKQLWPRAVWPSSIPGTAPLALILESKVITSRDSGRTNVSFNDLMGEAELLAGGTIGDDINFLTSISVSDEGIDIEMGYLGFYNIIDNARLNLKIGQFPPEVLFISNHRRFGSEYWITTKTVGNNQWSLEDSQKGFQAGGMVANNRLAYNVGLVEGRGNLQNNYKDSYFHLAYKFGGIAYNGSGDSTRNAMKQLWGDNSVQIGTFVYIGKAKIEQDLQNSFRLYGGDFEANYNYLRVNGGFAYRTDHHPFTSNTDRANTTLFFIEGDYMIYPWLIPTLRYEYWKIDVESSALQRIVPGIEALIRANVRSYISAAIKNPDNSYDLEQLDFGLVFGF